MKHPDRKNITFLYFLYNPSALPLTEKRDEINAIYKETRQAAETYAFDEIFSVVVDYLIQEEGLRASQETILHLKQAFSFCFCDQNDYINHLK